MTFASDKAGGVTATLPYIAQHLPEHVSAVLESVANLAAASNALAKSQFVTTGTMTPNIICKVPDPAVHTGMSVALSPVDVFYAELQEFAGKVISGARAHLQQSVKGDDGKMHPLKSAEQLVTEVKAASAILLHDCLADWKLML